MFSRLYKEVLFDALSKLQLKENHDEDSCILLYDSLCLCSGYARYVSSCSISDACSFTVLCIGTKFRHTDDYRYNILCILLYIIYVTFRNRNKVTDMDNEISPPQGKLRSSENDLGIFISIEL